MKIFVFCFLLYFFVSIEGALKARTVLADLLPRNIKINNSHSMEKRDIAINLIAQYNSMEEAECECNLLYKL